MREADLIRWLYNFSRSGKNNHQEGLTIREAAETITELRSRVNSLTRRLEDAEERVAIMMEGDGISRERLEQMVMEAHDAENAGRYARGDGHSGGGHRYGGQGGRD